MRNKKSYLFCYHPAALLKDKKFEDKIIKINKLLKFKEMNDTKCFRHVSLTYLQLGIVIVALSIADYNNIQK